MGEFGQPRKKLRVDTDLPRDGRGRPLIVPPGGGAPVPYTRVSTLAKTLDDTYNLHAWDCRMVAHGVASRPDLIAMASGLDPHDPDDRGRLNETVKAARAAAAADRAANMGTGLHTWTERLDEGGDISGAPADLLPRLEAYRAATSRFRPLIIEQFVVNDELRAAGTLDRGYAVDGYPLAIIGDLKTGKRVPDQLHSIAIQLATYVNGAVYDPATGARHPLSDYMDVTTGIVMWLPAAAEEPFCHIYRLNLVEGLRAARVATWVRAWQSAPAGERWFV